ncbi:MAG: hypothetical protein ACLQBD_29575 [Syntrophobacteraceae bacterium]
MSGNKAITTVNDKYAKLTKRSKLYAKAGKDGIEVSGEVYGEIVGLVKDWTTYFYRWDDGNKDVYSDPTPAEIQQFGLKQGASFTFAADDFNSELTIDLPVSSFVEFSNYATQLVNRGLTLETVITRVSTFVKSFGKGRRQPVFAFELVRIAGDLESKHDLGAAVSTAF